MNTKYVITGGFGLIGSALVNKLNGDVRIISRSTANSNRITISNPEIRLKDLRNITTDDIDGADYVYHCASTVDNYNVLSDPFIDMETNIRGTIALLEACKNAAKKPMIIFLSTFFVYGNVHDKIKKPITEDSPTDPLAIYPATKLCAESIIKLYGRLYDMPYRICRLTNVYGAEESFDNKKKGALNYLIMRAVRGETLTIYKGGNFYRDYIYVDDVISALLFLEKKNELNQTFLIGYGKPVWFRDLITYLHSITGKKSPIHEIESPRFHTIVGIGNFSADISKMKKLGWKPVIDYKEGLQLIVNKYSNASLS